MIGQASSQKHSAKLVISECTVTTELSLNFHMGACKGSLPIDCFTHPSGTVSGYLPPQTVGYIINSSGNGPDVFYNIIDNFFMGLRQDNSY